MPGIFISIFNGFINSISAQWTQLNKGDGPPVPAACPHVQRYGSEYSSHGAAGTHFWAGDGSCGSPLIPVNEPQRAPRCFSLLSCQKQDSESSCKYLVTVWLMICSRQGHNGLIKNILLIVLIILNKNINYFPYTVTILYILIFSLLMLGIHREAGVLAGGWSCVYPQHLNPCIWKALLKDSLLHISGLKLKYETVWKGACRGKKGLLFL